MNHRMKPILLWATSLAVVSSFSLWFTSCKENDAVDYEEPLNPNSGKGEWERMMTDGTDEIFPSGTYSRNSSDFGRVVQVTLDRDTRQFKLVQRLEEDGTRTLSGTFSYVCNKTGGKCDPNRYLFMFNFLGHLAAAYRYTLCNENLSLYELDETGSWAGDVPAHKLFNTLNLQAQGGATRDPSCETGVRKKVKCKTEQCRWGGEYDGVCIDLMQHPQGADLICNNIQGTMGFTCPTPDAQCRFGTHCRDIGDMYEDLECKMVDGVPTFGCAADECRWEDTAICLAQGETRGGKICRMVDGVPVLKLLDGNFCSASDACDSGNCAPSITVAVLDYQPRGCATGSWKDSKNTTTYGASSGSICSPVNKCAAIVNSICGSDISFVELNDTKADLTCTKEDPNSSNMRWLPGKGTVCLWEGHGKDFRKRGIEFPCALEIGPNQEVVEYECIKGENPLLLTSLCCPPGHCARVYNANEPGKCLPLNKYGKCPRY